MIVAAWGWCYLPPGEDERSWSRDMLASGCGGADNRGRRKSSKEKKSKKSDNNSEKGIDGAALLL